MDDNYPVRTHTYADDAFPPCIADQRLEPPCTVLYSRGAIPDSMRRVGIVGTRKASAFGKRFAHACGYELASRGICVVSGLAYGIDIAAHSGALEAKGPACAVLAHGLDRVYPAEHERHAEDILRNGGSLLSEYAEGTPPLPFRFLERNRIVSALSDTLIVIEAPKDSGSLSTAKHATRLGKQVLVVPGSPSSFLYAGSHALIRTGARLCASISDILEDMGIGAPEPAGNGPGICGPARVILEFLRSEPGACSVDKIVDHTTLKPQEVRSALSELTLADAVSEDSLGSYCPRI